MRLQEWEVTIQKMIDECIHKQTRVDTVLMAWRAKLEKEPTLLQAFAFRFFSAASRCCRGESTNSMFDRTMILDGLKRFGCAGP